MKLSAEAIPGHVAAGGKASEPSIAFLVVLFWCIFAVSVAASVILDPSLFIRQDPDSIMRLVEVRDLFGGQAWLDLVQHRIDPPGGVIMHWSRLIDAPIAGLILIGDLFGIGESFALTAWPLILLLGLMSATASVAFSLGGRRASIWSLVLLLLCLEPLLFYLPNDIDHHNAQIALVMATLALAMRLEARPLLGFFAGCTAAITLAIGLEMLPHVVVLTAVLALRWAIDGRGGRGLALYGLALGIAPAALFALTGSPLEPAACDALSWSYAVPAAIGGIGLAGLVVASEGRGGWPIRLGGLATIGAAGAAVFVLRSPECLAGPYGMLSPELKAIFLDTVTEAQPYPVYAANEPIGAIASLGPPAVALLVALLRAWPGARPASRAWLLPTALIGLGVAMSFYQVRTLPLASAVSIAVLGAWIAEIAQQYGVVSWRPVRRLAPVIAALLVCMPLVHLAAGWGAVEALGAATGGRVAPPAGATMDDKDGLTAVERDCLGAPSAALLAEVQPGLVLTPVFYGPALLSLSAHSVVAGPYHRAGAAIADTIAAVDGDPATAHAIIAARHVDYVAVCASSHEAAISEQEKPNGFVADLLQGRTPDWLAPVAAKEPTMLKLWRVLR